MSEDKFYLKFRKADGSSQVDRYQLFKSEQEAKNWRPDRKRPESKDTEEPAEGYESIFEYIAESMDSFRASSTLMPILSAMLPEAEVDKLFKTSKKISSKINETHKYTTAEISISKFNHIEKHLKIIRQLSQAHPLIKGVLLLGLVSICDEITSRLLSYALNKDPRLILNSEKTISMEDLYNSVSKDEILQKYIDKKIEKILRQSHSEQFHDFSNFLSFNATQFDNYSSYLEICERRNLFAHNGGIVNDLYIRKCKEYGIDVSNIDTGSQIKINRKYFNESIDTIEEVCTKLVQSFWRKFSPEELNKADIALNARAVDLISEKRSDLATNLIDFALSGLPKQMRHRDDHTRRMLIINLANSYRASGNSNKAAEIIDAEDWSSVSSIFKLCAHSIKNEYDKAFEVLSSMSVPSDISASSMKEWPVFSGLRSDPNFAEEYKKKFGEPYIDEFHIAPMNADEES